MGFASKVLADSVNVHGTRLITFQATFPRCILAEVNTHRVLSRNSASSRAIPVAKQIARVLEVPFIPVDAAWGKNQKGMQSSVLLTDAERASAVDRWLWARDRAVEAVRALSDPDGLDVHKQIANRLLEPFMWHTAIISATERLNLFALRTHKATEPHFQILAKMLVASEQASVPKFKEVGEWHLPLVEGVDHAELKASYYSDIEIARISCARCGRVSYLTHDGKRDPAEDLAMADRLQAPGHMSPFEHAAQAMNEPKVSGNFHGGWAQYRKRLPNEALFVPRDAP